MKVTASGKSLQIKLQDKWNRFYIFSTSKFLLKELNGILNVFEEKKHEKIMNNKTASLWFKYEGLNRWAEIVK